MRVLNLLFGIGAVACVQYSPISDFRENLQRFREHERTIAKEENAKIIFPNSETLRMTHLSADWRGMSIEEYIGLSEATSSDILIARGVPQHEGYKRDIEQKLGYYGWDASTRVQEPCAALPSGLVIGVRNGVKLAGLAEHRHGKAVVALEALFKVGEEESFKALILTVDPLDHNIRLEQLPIVQKLVTKLESAGDKFIIVGGFFTAVHDFTKEMRIIHSGGKLTNAFNMADRPYPSYTSFLGVFSDTAFISEKMKESFKDVSVYHTEVVDCLPVMVDLKITGITRGIVKTVSNKACNILGNRYLQIGILSFLVAFLLFLVILGIRKYRNRVIVCNIQATGKYNDEKVQCATVEFNRNDSNKIDEEDDESYPDEKI